MSATKICSVGCLLKLRKLEEMLQKKYPQIFLKVLHLKNIIYYCMQAVISIMECQ